MKLITTLAATLLAGCPGVKSNPVEDALPDTPPDMPPDMTVLQGKRIFVTSTLYQGGLLGGLSGADAKCAERAAAAGLTGTYLAWLSTSAMPARDRLAHSVEPYVLVDGSAQIAASWTALISGTLSHAIDRDEHGTPVTGPITCTVVGGLVGVWTGTEFDGTYSTAVNNCSGWSTLTGSATTGNAVATTTKWTSNSCVLTCSESGALYCIEQ